MHRILAVVNIAVLLVLYADNFLLPVTRVPEIYDRRYSIDTHGYDSRDYSTDYIKAVSGDEVQVPANWQYSNIGMNEGDNGYWGTLLALLILAVSFIHLLPKALIRNKNLNERLIFSGSAILVVLVLGEIYPHNG